jgi:hypothetical protein
MDETRVQNKNKRTKERKNRIINGVSKHVDTTSFLNELSVSLLFSSLCSHC